MLKIITHYLSILRGQEKKMGKISEIIFILILVFPAIGFADSQSIVNGKREKSLDTLEFLACSDIKEKNVLTSGWYEFEPYQFDKIMAGGHKLEGMDIDLVKAISAKIGIIIKELIIIKLS